MKSFIKGEGNGDDNFCFIIKMKDQNYESLLFYKEKEPNKTQFSVTVKSLSYLFTNEEIQTIIKELFEYVCEKSTYRVKAIAENWTYELNF